MDKYQVTVGLEIHAELKTQTKMFCDSRNDPDERRPNINICPICMGYPGTLPTINKEALKHIIRVGLALGGDIADFTEFDRKNYFYPDIPKGYQISQYKFPLVRGGSLNGVAVTRVHLEEDTARSTHHDNYSLIDFNRAGVPLMELVTEPTIHSAEEASRFARELQLLLNYLGAGEANMEKGEMRVEANVSVALVGEKALGTKVEVKNLNSFKAVEKAIGYEIERQVEVLEDGEMVLQETRGWDEKREITFSQRAKEESHDYRYFPEPDLPKIFISEIPDLNPHALKDTIPELPWQKRGRYINGLAVKGEDVEVYVRNPNWAEFFEKVVVGLSDKPELIQTASNYITSDLAGLVKADGEESFGLLDINSKIDAKNFTKIISMVSSGLISSRGAKEILRVMYRSGGEPEAIAEAEDLLQKSDEGHLRRIAEDVIKDNPAVTDSYKSGKEASLQFLVGQGMKISKGSANPEVLKKILIEVIRK